MKIFLTITLLIISNVFMTFAWYGHLKLREFKWFETLPLLAVIIISWGIAFFEYIFQVPANRIGFKGNDGPFSINKLKFKKEVISQRVFIVFTGNVF